MRTAPQFIDIDNPLGRVRVAVERTAFDSLLQSAIRARQALNDGLPNIAEAILEAAIDDAYAALGQVAA